LFFVTGYWFIFFKIQDTVFCLIPDMSSPDYSSFYVTFGIMVACQFISVLDIIRRQCNVDFIILDWEKPKMFVKRDPESPPTPMVSAWRTLFICNEMNELQTKRYITFEFMILIYAFFMRGLDWENLSQATPQWSLTVGGTENPVLKYFLSCFILFVIGVVMLGLRKGVSTWYPTDPQAFVDLCSFANISIFMLDSVQHGYYIHGISPSGTAEGTVEFLRMSLERESRGHGRSRGMVPGDPQNLQTFEIFLPLDMRIKYNGIFKFHVERESADKNRILNMNNQAIFKGLNKPFPEGFDFAFIEKKKNGVASYFEDLH